MAKVSYSQEILTVLKENKSSYGISLYDHLQTLFRKLNQEKVDEFYNFENIEIISDMLKQSQFIYNEIKSVSQLAQGSQRKQNIWVSECLNLLNSLKIKNYQKVKVGQVQNFLQDSKILEWAGVGFGESESFWIQKSMQKLAIDTQAQYIRFWGKILTKGNDYYVCEGKIKQSQNIKSDRNYELEGTGVNELTFWVTHSTINEWTKLPQISQQQLQISRQIQPILEGLLDAKVNTFPAFPGFEKHLLKSILVRITYGSVICPKGLYRLNEETCYIFQFLEEIEFEDEFKMPEMTELSNLENWVHQTPNILKAGRVFHLTPEGVSEEERDAQMAELAEKDPIIERLKGISEDKPIEGFESNWLIRTVGDPQQYNQISEEGNLSYNFQVIKSLVWTGSITVSSAKKFIGIYVGYGQKQGANSFNPTSPENLLQDPEDNEEQPEVKIQIFQPNPKEQVYQVEPDSDDENKKNEDDEDS